MSLLISWFQSSLNREVSAAAVQQVQQSVLQSVLGSHVSILTRTERLSAASSLSGLNQLAWRIALVSILTQPIGPSACLCFNPHSTSQVWVADVSIPTMAFRSVGVFQSSPSLLGWVEWDVVSILTLSLGCYCRCGIPLILGSVSILSQPLGWVRLNYQPSRCSRSFQVSILTQPIRLDASGLWKSFNCSGHGLYLMCFQSLPNLSVGCNV